MGDFDNLVLIEMDQIDKFVEYIENYNETNNHSKNKKLIDECYSSKVIASHFEKIYKELDIAN
jgi:hemerythrin-like domain-containing protein